ncbi:MAG TPA: hypothetical protein VGK73_02035 [Polyangiaceae bacterium]
MSRGNASTQHPGDRPAPLAAVLGVTFLGSITGGVFWAGIYFLTREHYRFSPERNLALALAMGAIYAVSAWGAGRIFAVLGGQRGPRRVVAGVFAVWGAAALVPVVFPNSEVALWVAALAGAVTSGLVWPVVESYLGGGRHGEKLRSALGWFNVTWTSATALPLLILPLLERIHPLAAFALCAVANAGAILALQALPLRPGAAEPEHSNAAIGREYPFLLDATRWLLPLSYLLSSTLAPVLPYRLSALGAGAVPESVIAATWMLARFLTLGFMARVHVWHGRWAALFLGGASLAGGVALALLAPNLPLAVLGLFLFGVGMGVTYFSSIYYSLAVGHGAVDAGGGFEALIGLGYVLGPLVGLGARSLSLGSNQALATAGCASFVALLGGAFSLRPYFAARAGRRLRRAHQRT